MNCSEFWENGPEHSTHFEECPRCRAAWEAETRLAAALRIAAPELSNQEAPARVESRLLAAMRAQAGLKLIPRRPRWVDILTWASASAAIAVLAVFLIRDRPRVPERHIHPAAVELASAEPQPEIATAVESEFIPLPNVEALAADEEVNLVRMELPRSTMIAMGFDMDEEDRGESIAADVVLGSDGLARAVRLVEE